MALSKIVCTDFPLHVNITKKIIYLYMKLKLILLLLDIFYKIMYKDEAN